MSIEAINRLLLEAGCFAGGTIDGWTTDPMVLVPLLLGLVVYATGLFRLWGSAGLGHGTSSRQAMSFALGWALMAVALVSPLHDVSRRLFWGHMVEHELVMTVAAPLLVLSRPLGVLLWAFPRPSRPSVARATRIAAYLLGWDVLSRPLVATALHALAIWFWHVPAVFDAALGSEGLHWLQHLSFFVTAMFFWWSLAATRHNQGVAVFCLFATGLHTGGLGILLAMARQPMYPLQAGLARSWNVDPLFDQQLAGLIMWVPAGMVYVAAGLLLAARWIGHSSQREAGLVRSA